MSQTTLDATAGAMPMDEVCNPVRDRAAVIVVHEALGVNEHLQDVLVRVSAAGYHAVAPHLYHRCHQGPIAYGDYDTIFAQLGALRDPEVLRDIDGTVAYLSGRGWRREQIAVIGFNIGARVSFLAARNRRLGAAVGFYGGGIVSAPEKLVDTMPGLLDDEGPTTITTPWLGIYGEADHSLPQGDIDSLERALAGQQAKVIRIPEAGHAFHSDARPELYDAAAARRAWTETLAWFDQHLTLRA